MGDEFLTCPREDPHARRLDTKPKRPLEFQRKRQCCSHNFLGSDTTGRLSLASILFYLLRAASAPFQRGASREATKETHCLKIAAQELLGKSPHALLERYGPLLGDVDLEAIATSPVGQLPEVRFHLDRLRNLRASSAGAGEAGSSTVKILSQLHEGENRDSWKALGGWTR